MDIKGQKILILSPHTDDAEIGAGATICKLAKNNELFHASFSFAYESLPAGVSKDSTKNEFFKSLKLMDIPDKNSINFNYKVRFFSEQRQSILEDLIYLKKIFNPNIVFTTSSFDNHQDHKVIREESFRAFKDSTIFGYEMPSNNINFSPNLFVKLSEEDLFKKIKLIKVYKSQIVKMPFLLDLIPSLAIHRGYQIKQKYAEAFEIIRLIM